jgi:hypothetical protein
MVVYGQAVIVKCEKYKGGDTFCDSQRQLVFGDLGETRHNGECT